ncbi:zinc-binding alcohol dehydrogenase family protein [Kribbella sp. NPDC048915]|uniref:quinone oxidoreductase family protein n=1 Tax=Kribbella sp. NPDC048915 TaxID=3155148 RepID=UPI00340EBE1A
MDAAVVHAYGQVPALSEWAEPEPAAGQALIRNLAAAVNPVDLKMAAGSYYFGAPDPPYVAGAEGVGSVLRSAAFEAGRRVWYERGPLGGAFAELTAVDDAHLVEIPDGLADPVAATLGVAGLAAWDALGRRGGLRSGESVLVLGAGGAVGQFAVQIAKIMGAARVVAATRNPAVMSSAALAAADQVIRLDSAELATLVSGLQAGAPRGYDVILDPVWGLAAQAALACAADGARLVQIGSSGGETLELPAGLVRRSTASILGYTIYAIPWPEKRAAYQALAEHVMADRLRVELETLPLARVAEAWGRQAASPGVKLVLEP